MVSMNQLRKKENYVIIDSIRSQSRARHYGTCNLRRLPDGGGHWKSIKVKFGRSII